MAQHPAERHPNTSGVKAFRFGDFVLDETRCALLRGDHEIPLRRQAYDMLLLFVRHQGELITKDRLMTEIWGDAIVTENSVTQCLRDIRHAIGDHELSLIRTVPRRGYIFKMPVSFLEAESDPAPITGGASGNHRWRLATALSLTLALAVLGYFALDPPAFQPAHDAEIGEAAPTEREMTAQGETPSIAVLPLLDLSSQGDFAYFADGLTEDILNLLAGNEGLRVAARTSSFYFKGRLGQVSLDEIARQLQVDHVLEGSVRKDGDRIRITVQLIKTDSGFHQWSNTWDRNLDDIFAIQNEIAAAVMDELEFTLLGDSPRAAVVNAESYELVLRGRYLLHRRGKGDLPHALEFFERATQIDPDNAAAWLGLVPLYLWLFDPPRLEQALSASERAVALDSRNPEAWGRRAFTLWASGNNDEAETAWIQAKRWGKNNALIQSQVAGLLAYEGNIEGAIAAQERAVALDPLYVANLGNLATYQILGGRLEDAQSTVVTMQALAPDNHGALTAQGTIDLLRNRPEQAREVIERRSTEDLGMAIGGGSGDFWDALIEHALGNDGASDAALERFIENEGDSSPVEVACIYAWRGEIDPAFAWLDRALTQDPELSLVHAFEPWLDPLRDDARWESLMTRWKVAISPIQALPQ